MIIFSPDAIASLSSRFGDGDEVGVFAFDKDFRRVSAFGNNRRELRRSLSAVAALAKERKVEPNKRSLNDALLMTAAELELRPAERRKTIIVLSGGEYGTSGRSLTTAQNRLTQQQTQIFGIVLGQFFTIPPHDPRAVLRPFTEVTGGEVYRAPTEERLDPALCQVLDQAHHQYLLSYVSNNAGLGKGGVRRQIEVRVNWPGLTVRYRKSYLTQGETR